MKTHPSQFSSGPAAIRRILVAASVAMLPLALHAATPGWWSTWNVIQTTGTAANPVDYAEANQGQVKNIAKAAMFEMDTNLGTDGAGAAVHGMVAAWSGTTFAPHDYAAVNLGQLKTIAKPFYDRLLSVGFHGHPLESGTYPWLSGTANDYAMANIGQVKNLFSFDMAFDGDVPPNGLPDWWELHWFGHTRVDPNAPAARGDGLTNLQAYQQGLDPIDFFNGQTPLLAIVDGNNQTGSPGRLVPKALVVSVALADHSPLGNAPVTFTVTSGTGLVQKSSSSIPASSIEVRTDSNGLAKAYFSLSSANPNNITATAGVGDHSSQAVFTEYCGTGVFADPFAPTDVVASMNADGSVDVTWTNHTDPGDTEPINLRFRDGDGNWKTAATIPAGNTSWHIPPQ